MIPSCGMQRECSPVLCLWRLKRWPHHCENSCTTLDQPTCRSIIALWSKALAQLIHRHIAGLGHYSVETPGEQWQKRFLGALQCKWCSISKLLQSDIAKLTYLRVRLILVVKHMNHLFQQHELPKPALQMHHQRYDRYCKLCTWGSRWGKLPYLSNCCEDCMRDNCKCETSSYCMRLTNQGISWTNHMNKSKNQARQMNPKQYNYAIQRGDVSDPKSICQQDCTAVHVAVHMALLPNTCCTSVQCQTSF